MPKFSDASARRLATCSPHLQEIMRRAIQITDFTVLCGYRTKAEQDKAYAEKRSQTPWPKSLHNQEPSRAVDIAPYPIEWPDAKTDNYAEYARKLGRFYQLAGVVKAFAAQLGIPIRWGGDWLNFKDYPHFELIL
jgi:peptidoglycan L-alanyl-D-glutamate endopeptidase CwlK